MVETPLIVAQQGAEVLEKRRQAYTAPEPVYTRGVLAKFARLVQGAETGAITNPR